MASTIISIFLLFCTKLVNAVFTPVFNLMDTLLDSIESTFGIPNYLEMLLDVIDDYVVPLVGFFFEILPPLTSDLIYGIITFLISFYVISFTYHIIVSGLNLIKKLPLA